MTTTMSPCLECDELTPNSEPRICDYCAEHRAQIDEANSAFSSEICAVANKAAEGGATPERAREAAYAAWSAAANGHGPLSDYFSDDAAPIDDARVREDLDATLAQLERDFEAR